MDEVIEAVPVVADAEAENPLSRRDYIRAAVVLCGYQRFGEKLADYASRVSLTVDDTLTMWERNEP